MRAGLWQVVESISSDFVEWSRQARFDLMEETVSVEELGSPSESAPSIAEAVGGPIENTEVAVLKTRRLHLAHRDGQEQGAGIPTSSEINQEAKWEVND